MNIKRILLAAFLVFSVLFNTEAQTLSSQLPVDPKVKIGQLENGLTYYIRENEKPMERVELRLVVNTGSIMENDDQLGLAHFTEHMAFNGTENFEKNDLVSYLQSIGVQFGADLNAYTSFDETVYMLPIPTDKPELVDQGLKILKDWATNLTFDPEEIEKERGVVIEEWRLGQGSQRRMLDEYLPVVFKDSRYAERLPIGTKEVLENFEHQTLIDFYEEWYRPDLMAVIAVGAIDPDEFEDKIEAYFGDIPKKKSPRERKNYTVPDHDETYVAITSDKEASFTRLMIFFKKDPEKISNQNDYRDHMLSNIFVGMLNERLNELRQEADPPFIYASTNAGSTWARTKSAFQAFASVKEDGIEEGLVAIMEELKRVKQHGFTPGELERYKKIMLKNYERTFNERDKTESAAYVNEYINNFLEDGPIPGISFEYNFVKQQLDGISLDEVNQLIDKFISKDNRVVVITAPEKEGLDLPSKDNVLNIIDEVSQRAVDPYEDIEVSDQLISELPNPGTIQDENYIAAIDVTELDLSNGIKVFLKPTDFKNDELLINAYSPGGYSLAGDDIFYSASNASAIIGSSGFGEFSATDLSKALAGKTVTVNPYIGQLSEGIGGRCSPKDIETMFQLVHMAFTQPRKDEKAFQSYIARTKGILANIEANPQYYFYDRTQKILSQDHPRGGGIPTVEEINQIDHNEVYEFYKERFKDASDFTFWITGNISTDSIKSYINQYLGSLPSINRDEKWKDNGVRPPDGMVQEKVYKGSDPKSMVVMVFHGKEEKSKDLDHDFQTLSELLNIKLVETLREDQSGVYGIGASASLSERPYPHYTIRIQFPCAPENVDKLVQEVFAVVDGIKENGVSEEDLVKLKEQQRRNLEVQKERNNFWQQTMREYFINDWDLKEIASLEELTNNLKGEDVQKIASNYIDDEYIQIVLYPEAYASSEE